jgi:very-short-patch-repair endonuclease
MYNKEYFKQYHLKNIERIKLRNKKTYSENKETVKNKSKEYYHKNREKISIKSKLKYPLKREENKKQCSERYYKNKKKCPKCNKLISGVSLFCHSHRIITKETGKKISISKKGIATNTGYKQSEDAKRKISLANKGRKLSIESRKKIKLARAKQIIPPCSEEKKKKIGDANRGKTYSPKTTFKKGQDIRRVYRETSIERKMALELDKRNVSYLKNKWLKNIANVDFYLPKENMVIECDGDYWHNLPGMKEKDDLKTQKLIEVGYKVFRFWEHEINKSPKDCVDQVFV